MRPGDRNELLTVEQAIQEGARMTDPDHRSDAVAALVKAFEDDERPATSVEDLAGELDSAAVEIDPEGLAPEASVTAAAAFWLATNPGAVDDPERTIREGVRLFFGDDPPERVVVWLRNRQAD